MNYSSSPFIIFLQLLVILINPAISTFIHSEQQSSSPQLTPGPNCPDGDRVSPLAIPRAVRDKIKVESVLNVVDLFPDGYANVVNLGYTRFGCLYGIQYQGQTVAVAEMASTPGDQAFEEQINFMIMASNLSSSISKH
ncbi:hypothetical protein FRC03_004501 [Tulasnella sp. 419]|nr:hypothetical protein FRC02_000976 [Tulasnella sp. 418]KAG8941459.1 hypothetical protein FRC03_004501 [Tulasnella sp. 419]